MRLKDNLYYQVVLTTHNQSSIVTIDIRSQCRGGKSKIYAKQRQKKEEQFVSSAHGAALPGWTCCSSYGNCIFLCLGPLHRCMVCGFMCLWFYCRFGFLPASLWDTAGTVGGRTAGYGCPYLALCKSYKAGRCSRCRSRVRTAPDETR